MSKRFPFGGKSLEEKAKENAKKLIDKMYKEEQEFLKNYDPNEKIEWKGLDAQLKDGPIFGINPSFLKSLERKLPDNWDEIKQGFTQAEGCTNCGSRWSIQLMPWDAAINSVRMNEYCSKCYKGEDGE